MGRDQPPDIAGGTYHVMNRGNRKQTIFEDDQDRRQFLRGLIREQEIYGVRILGGCLMDNHFHLAVVTPNANLSDFMEQLEGQFARYYNWRHDRVGHLFQGRFRRVLIEDDIHLLTAGCYIFMNPVAAGLVAEPHEYKWSTFAATVGLRPASAFLDLGWVETLFPTATLQESQRQFQKLLSHPHPVALYCRGDELSVSPEVVKHVIRSYTGKQLHQGRLPRLYRTALRPSLAELGEVCGDNRLQLISEGRVIHGYTNVELAQFLGLHPATVSKYFNAQRRLSDAA